METELRTFLHIIQKSPGEFIRDGTVINKGLNLKVYLKTSRIKVGGTH